PALRASLKIAGLAPFHGCCRIITAGVTRLSGDDRINCHWMHWFTEQSAVIAAQSRYTCGDYSATSVEWSKTCNLQAGT
ncbi:MAG: hypothetical protein O9272_13020, partial [Brevundimonas sp.]|nr:hypothetical protein [Brevundimonas sp.]